MQRGGELLCCLFWSTQIKLRKAGTTEGKRGKGLSIPWESETKGTKRKRIGHWMSVSIEMGVGAQGRRREGVWVYGIANPLGDGPIGEGGAQEERKRIKGGGADETRSRNHG